jgi:hypothetical protein
MNRSVLLVLTLGAFGLGTTTAMAQDDDGPHGTLLARLRPHNEVPTVISDAEGDFRATVDLTAQTMEFELSYSGLEGNVTQAHIHIGQPFAAGGISLWFCANNPPITNAPLGTPSCPASPAKFTGVVDANDVVGPAGQAVPAGAFADLIEAIRTGNAYVNVHSTAAPGGEVRGQIRGGGGGDGGVR